VKIKGGIIMDKNTVKKILSYIEMNCKVVDEVEEYLRDLLVDETNFNKSKSLTVNINVEKLVSENLDDIVRKIRKQLENSNKLNTY
jgi:hypothetical protein